MLLTGIESDRLTDAQLHQIILERVGRRHIAEEAQSPVVAGTSSVPADSQISVFLDRTVQQLAENSISKSSYETYGSGLNKFLAFLSVMKLSLDEATVNFKIAQLYTCRFAVWLFIYEGFQVSSIKNYIATISFLFFVNHITPGSLWHPFLNRIVKGIESESAHEKNPLSTVASFRLLGL